jgi:hypothetical protein
VVVLAELRVFRVIVDAWDLTLAIVVGNDEDEALVTNTIYSVEVEVSVVVDGDLEALGPKLDSVLALRHNGVLAVVRENGLDQRGLGGERFESGFHVVRVSFNIINQLLRQGNQTH